MYWKTPLTLVVLGLAVLGVLFGVAFATSQAGVEGPLLLRLPMLAIIAIAAGVVCIGLWGLLLAASPKLRRHVEELESQPKHKRFERQGIEARDREHRAKRRKGH